MKIRVLHVIDHLGYGGAPLVVKDIAEKTDVSLVETVVCLLRTNPRPISIKTKLIHRGYEKNNAAQLKRRI